MVLFGATGTIGAYLALDLIAYGYNVVAIGHRLSDNGFFAQYNIPYFSVNIAEKKSFECLPKQDVFAVINLAGAIPARMKGYYPQSYIDSIITGTLNILDYCVAVKANRIVFSQSISDVSYLCGNKKPILENSLMQFPINNDHSVYSICKTTAVHLIQHYAVRYGLKYFILRFPNIYLYHPNPMYYVDGQMKWQGYRLLIEKAKKGEVIEMWGDPNRVRDIVYVKDCNQIIINTLMSTSNGGIYNVGTGVGTSLRQQIEGIIKVFSPQDNPSTIIERPDMPDAPEYIMDISKTISDLGYKPQYDYLSYLKDMKREMQEKRFQILWGKDVLE